MSFWEMRNRRGDAHPASKLSPQQRHTLRTAYGPGVSMRELARRLKVSESTVRRCLRGETYTEDEDRDR